MARDAYVPTVTHMCFSCTVFAYGVTSSGKTHTIQGSPAEPGIIPRVVRVGIQPWTYLVYC